MSNLDRFVKLAFYTDSGATLPSDYAAFSDYTQMIPHNPGQAAVTILSDKNLSPIQKTVGMMLVDRANQQRQSFGFTTSDIIRAGVGAGLGYGAAAVTGKVLGAVFSLSPEAQTNLARAGAVGGLLKATGIWK